MSNIQLVPNSANLIDPENVNPLLVPLSPKFFREGTQCRTRAVNFILVQGGLGDFIGYMTAIKYIADNFPNILGRLYCFSWFMPVAENILKNYPDWKVMDHAGLTKKHMTTRPTFAPCMHPIDRFGASAIDLGFIYFLNMTAPPDEMHYYPRLDLSAIDELKSPIENYAVMTPVASNKPKMLLAETFNGIKDYLISKGITPVFIGHKSFTKAKEKRTLYLSDEYDLSGGIDLVGKTTLLQAAGIMSKARMVIGLDNGLLHLAATTEVPIVFGYTFSSPDLTMPRRESGRIHNIFCDPKSLPCMFCMNRMRMMGNHDFKDCLYEDELCVKAIKDPNDWAKLIDEVIAKSANA